MTETPHASAVSVFSAAAAFLGVFSFLGAGAAAFFSLGAAAFLAAAGLAAVFATRPDLVLVNTVGFSTTASAW